MPNAALCLEHAFIHPIMTRGGPVGEWIEHEQPEQQIINLWDVGWRSRGTRTRIGVSSRCCEGNAGAISNFNDTP